jgi:hypothetical protein
MLFDPGRADTGDATRASAGSMWSAMLRKDAPRRHSNKSVCFRAHENELSR